MPSEESGSEEQQEEEIEDVEELQRAVDEAVGEAGLRDDVVVGEPMTVSEFAEMLEEMQEEGEANDDG